MPRRSRVTLQAQSRVIDVCLQTPVTEGPFRLGNSNTADLLHYFLTISENFCFSASRFKHKIKNKILPPQAYVIVADFGCLVWDLFFLTCSQLPLQYFDYERTDEGYSRMASCALNFISTFLLQRWNLG